MILFIFGFITGVLVATVAALKTVDDLIRIYHD